MGDAVEPPLNQQRKRRMLPGEDAPDCAHDLVQLKDMKDAGFKTYVEDEAYRARKASAWAHARAICIPPEAPGDGST